MKICRFVDPAEGGEARAGYLDGDVIVPVADGDGLEGDAPGLLDGGVVPEELLDRVGRQVGALV